MPRYVLLSGGVGGARFATGLARCLEPRQLTIIANTGDDFVHLGLTVCPDLDTLLYSLAGVVDPATGWGRADETWSCMATLEQLGGETWFRLGDRDLALHLERSRRLAAGDTLTAITATFCRRLDVDVELVPMSDTPIRTRLETDAGDLAFQDYFVRRQAEPRVRACRYEGASAAPPAANLAAALTHPELRAIFIAPSNPWLSIGPILAIPSLSAALRSAPVPVIAVSPIVGGRAIKGPTGKIMAELGLPVCAAAVAGHYRGIISGFILDEVDAAQAGPLTAGGLATAVTGTVMHTADDRVALARQALAFADGLAGR